MYNNELYHHGIKGQKWGAKNGPPYPLNASDHSASERKAGWKKSLDKSSDSSKKLSRKEKRAQRKYNRVVRRVEKKLLEAGWHEGAAAYHINEGKAEAAKHTKKAAAALSEGNTKKNLSQQLKAVKSKEAAKKLADPYKETAAYYKEKASKIASKHNVMIGKERISELLKQGRKEGLAEVKEYEESEAAFEKWLDED